MQLARAFCAYGNGGRLLRPRLIKGVLDASGNVVERSEPQSLAMMPEAVDPVTAAAMNQEGSPNTVLDLGTGTVRRVLGGHPSGEVRALSGDGQWAASSGCPSR